MLIRHALGALVLTLILIACATNLSGPATVALLFFGGGAAIIVGAMIWVVRRHW